MKSEYPKQQLYDGLFKGEIIMKMRVWITGSILLAFLFSIGVSSNAGAQSSSEAQKKEKINRSGWIGIMVRDVNEKIARKAKLDLKEGAYVQEVFEDSPADSAGIQEGDVIVEFQGKKLIDSDDLIKAVRRTVPSTKVNLGIIREGEKKTTLLTVGTKYKKKLRIFQRPFDIPDVQYFSGNHILGLQLLTLNEQLGKYFGAPNNEGVLVESVERESAAEKAGIKAGDIIIRVGKKQIDAERKFQRELQKYEEGDKVEIEVLRNGTKKILSVEMEEEQCMQRQFCFPRPHFRMFHSEPFDDADIQLEMDRAVPKRNRIHLQFDEFLNYPHDRNTGKEKPITL
jgi:serine protease Do